jgi:hypothetical protein
MGERPSQSHTIHRLDSNGHYEPGNCVWAENEEQSNHRRDNRFISYQGREQTLEQWAREMNIDRCTLSDRLERGWTVERTLTQPVDARRRSKPK